MERMSQSLMDKTKFLNVDLDIFSKSDLQKLVEALGDDVYVLFVGRVKRHHEAHLELAGSHLPAASHQSNPESLILKFCKLIRRLSPEARHIWDSAKSRSFDIGIEAPGNGRYYWSAISDDAIRAAAEVGAQIAISVYGPMKVVKRPRKPAKSQATK